MKHSLEYGFKIKNQEYLKKILEPILNITFAEHETTEEQAYYFSGDLCGETFSIYFNYEDEEEYWRSPFHKDYPILFIIDDTPRSESLQKLLSEKVPELVLLEVYEEE